MAYKPTRISQCRGCGAQVFWATTHNGKWIPVDLEPVADGNLEVIPGTPPKAIPIAPLVPPADRYKSHFATCPKADDFRA